MCGYFGGCAPEHFRVWMLYLLGGPDEHLCWLQTDVTYVGLRKQKRRPRLQAEGCVYWRYYAIR